MWACSQRDVALLHGPPGTGKTTTLAATIAVLARAGRRIVAAAPSNVAVDNLAARLVAAGVSVVRVGHPGRVAEELVKVRILKCRMTCRLLLTPGLQRGMLQRLWRMCAATSTMSASASALRRLLSGLHFEKSFLSYVRTQLIYVLLTLGTELRTRETRAVAEVLSGASVVLGTPVGLADLPPLAADVAVVDEAGQALEIACWIPAMRAPRCASPPHVLNHTCPCFSIAS